MDYLEELLQVCLFMILTSFDHCTRLPSYEETVPRLDDQDPVQTHASPVIAERMILQLCCGRTQSISLNATSAVITIKTK